jgi:DNA-directed RNA polymerase specialized sigma subunit
MRAEAACAAWQAVCDYDPSLGVPFSAFAYQRVLTRTLTRYRQEWAYALRSEQEQNPEGSDNRALDCSASAVLDAWPRHALARLSKPDLWLIEQLFLKDRTEADIATQIGITQQAANKRKQIILLRLRACMTGASYHKEILSVRIDKSGFPLVEPGPVRPSKNKST